MKKAWLVNLIRVQKVFKIFSSLSADSQSARDISCSIFKRNPWKIKMVLKFCIASISFLLIARSNISNEIITIMRNLQSPMRFGCKVIKYVCCISNFLFIDWTVRFSATSGYTSGPATSTMSWRGKCLIVSRAFV